MDAKKFIMATLAGAVTSFLLGFIFYVVLLEAYFQSAAGSSAGFYRQEPILWSIFLGELTMAGLVTLIFARWASIRTLIGGAKGGALIGVFFGLAINLVLYGTTTMGTLMSGLVDSVISMIRLGITGGVIGWVLGRLSS
jgi:hypothetical protein